MKNLLLFGVLAVTAGVQAATTATNATNIVTTAAQTNGTTGTTTSGISASKVPAAQNVVQNAPIDLGTFNATDIESILGSLPGFEGHSVMYVRVGVRQRCKVPAPTIQVIKRCKATSSLVQNPTAGANPTNVNPNPTGTTGATVTPTTAAEGDGIVDATTDPAGTDQTGAGDAGIEEDGVQVTLTPAGDLPQGLGSNASKMGVASLLSSMVVVVLGLLFV